MSSSLVCCFCDSEIDKSSFCALDSVESCPRCGAVLAEEQKFSHDITTRDFSGSVANTDGSKRYGHGFDDHQRGRLPTQRISSGVRKIRRMIDNTCDKLRLSTESIQQVKEFVFRVNEHPKFMYRPGKYRMVAAGIYITCRANSIPVTLKQVALACGCCHFVIGDEVKFIDSIFELHQAPVTVSSLITKACSHLENSRECEEMAQVLCVQSQSAMVLSNPALPQAIAHAIIASLVINKGSTVKDQVKHLCLKMSHTGESAIYPCISALKTFIGELVKEIPWINTKYVKKSNVHLYLKDVVKYRQTVAAFPADCGSPTRFSERERQILERKEKIRKAQERIKLRKTQAVGESSKETGNDTISGEDEGSQDVSQQNANENIQTTPVKDTKAFPCATETTKDVDSQNASTGNGNGNIQTTPAKDIKVLCTNETAKDVDSQNASTGNSNENIQAISVKDTEAVPCTNESGKDDDCQDASTGNSNENIQTTSVTDTEAVPCIAETTNVVQLDNVALDDEDKLIEELLEMGCSLEELQEGFYENLKKNLTTSLDIQEEEITSYIRSPEEVDAVKRVGNPNDPSAVRVRKRQKLSEFTGQ